MAILKAKSGIHIKPENKGKFTATKKKTGKSTSELRHSKNPLTRKRAVFAANAKKWAKKRESGGGLHAEIERRGMLPPSSESRKCGGLMKRKTKIPPQYLSRTKKKQDGGAIQRQSFDTK